jgi:hypothetical protein
MNTKLFLVVLFGLLFSLPQNLLASPVNFSGGDPDVKVVVGTKRIWLVADEISVKHLTVQVLDEVGKIVMEKQFSSKTTDWSLRIESLPEGAYSVVVGKEKMADFKR